MIEKREKIHTRTIDIAAYAGTEDTIIVEGVLKDDRMFKSYRIEDKSIPPGTIHHMIIRIQIKGPQLVIEDIDVEMPTVPHEACRETLACLAPVKGMPIVPGFTNRIKKVAGGRLGCSHLVALLNAMAPAAVQGAFSATASAPIDPEGKDAGNLVRLKNTCWVWREGGPLMEMVDDLLKG